MQIVGYQKVSLLDFPEKVCCIVFTSGCNFRCPYCQNYSIATNQYKILDENDILNYIKDRKNMLDGICITGGEPLLQPDLKDFIIKVRKMGLKVKLDTNGYFPDKLQELLDEKLLDYVAMDIKNSLNKYALTTGVKNIDTNNIIRSIKILKNSEIPIEFRTTLIKQFHTLQDMEEMAKLVEGNFNYFIQNFEMSEDVKDKNLSRLSKEELDEFLNIAKKYNNNATFRGID